MQRLAYWAHNPMMRVRLPPAQLTIIPLFHCNDTNVTSELLHNKLTNKVKTIYCIKEGNDSLLTDCTIV